MAIQVTITNSRGITLDDLINLVPFSEAAKEVKRLRAAPTVWPPENVSQIPVDAAKQLPAVTLEQEAIKVLSWLADAYSNDDYRSSTLGYIEVLKGRATIRRLAAQRADNPSEPADRS